jgi:hypothetical protein
MVIDHKYSTERPNILSSRSVGASTFFKGLMWAAQAAKMGSDGRWGTGRKSSFGKITGWVPLA